MQGGGKTVLVVDDDAGHARLLELMLKAASYLAVTATSGEAALMQAQATPPHLVLLDVMMPGMDGVEVARRLKAGEKTKVIPVIALSALDDRQSRVIGLNASAEEFLSKPVDRAEFLTRVKNLLRLKEFNDFLADHNRILEAKGVERTHQLTESYRETILTMTRAVEYQDDNTGAHVRRISLYCRVLARQLGMDAEFCDRIYYASPMHDVSKIGIPDQILLKPRNFTPEEWKMMRTHTVIREKILARSDSPYLQMGAQIARSHHERRDGTGYPNGLTAEAIPLPARIMQIDLRCLRCVALEVPIQTCVRSREVAGHHHRSRRAHESRTLRLRRAQLLQDGRRAVPRDLGSARGPVNRTLCDRCG